MRGGDIASAEASQALVAELRKKSDDDPPAALARAFLVTNQRVRAHAGEQRDTQGMASTLVAALSRGDTAWLANVGDSRAYLFHRTQFRQLTLDHSLVAEQVRAGRLTAEEANRSEFRNVITRGIGVAETVEPDIIGPVTLPDGSLLLLCSDGLYRAVSEERIAEVLSSGTPAEMAARLIELANQGGGPDNIAVAILRSA